MGSEGASNNERLLAAAKADNEDLLLDVFGDSKPFDINYQDGLGNTALHYAVSHVSLSVVEHILSHEECDVDPVNRIEGDTPLHLAVKTENPDCRQFLVESLLEAGADTTIRNKYGQEAQDLVRSDDLITQEHFRRALAGASISRDDIAYDDEDEDDVASDSSD